MGDIEQYIGQVIGITIGTFLGLALFGYIMRAQMDVARAMSTTEYLHAGGYMLAIALLTGVLFVLLVQPTGVNVADYMDSDSE